MATTHADAKAVRGPSLPASITPAVLRRLTAQVSAAADADRVTTTAPYTGLPLTDLPVSTPADVEEAFARARVAQQRWAATPLRERKRILLRFHDLVLARQDQALDLMQAENGKTRRDAFLEVVDIGIVSRYYARTAGKYLRPKRRRGAIPLLTHTTELHHPKGVVTVVSPWNYPLSMAAGDTIAALMAGNAVVQKPDTQTALTALWPMDLMREAGLPPGVWQMVIGRGSSIGGALMDNADYMMFTGSTATGRQIAADAGRRLIGAAYDYSVDVGSLTTPAQLKTVTEHVGDAVAKGATVLAGGRARPDLGPLFHEPTILTDVTPDMTLHSHETFGPVVSVYAYRDEEEAVTLANATSYGLNASVWSRHGARGRAVAARVHAGTVNVNEAFAAAWGSVDAPMGGMGDSGLGRRHGAYGILKYTEPQTIAHQRVQGFTPPARISPETWATLLTGSIKLLKAVGAR
ncbi:succinate-semialdehyde dehydrogenase (NADP(+)) [Streptomyces sp. DH8]|uniref:succinate-semialdehyde dehydrogenase (NADP(+)) n=1 Tax=Streptomyces sp. DH8 TaxID=2857008 RepID=UPI001E35946B|nr:succinate-semialdehyde dehydrogenase (NADP(+)) [Streptomyces sp. DH8]